MKIVETQDEILDDPSVQLVLTSQIANERAGIAVRAMKHGKDVLSDKPGMTTLEQLAEVRKTIAETKRIYAILYSELLEVKAAVYAGELVRQGAIGKVIQTINIAPHQIVQDGGDAGGATPRPDWFWNPEQYGGILCDIGSHQVDQFLYYTGSTAGGGRGVADCQRAPSRAPALSGLRRHGAARRSRLRLRAARLVHARRRWEPGATAGCSSWAPTATSRSASTPTSRVSHQGNNLFIVDSKQARYIDCNQMPLPVRAAVCGRHCEPHAHWRRTRTRLCWPRSW